MPNLLAESPDVVRMRLVNGKVTLVHRRLWPALVRIADRFPAKNLAAIHEEHTASGAHRVQAEAFPDWVPNDVLQAAKALLVAADSVRPAQEGLPNIENRLAEHGFTSIWQLTPARPRGIVALSGGTVDTLMAILRSVARTRTGVSPVFQSLRETPRALHLAGVAAASGAAGAVTALSASPLAALVAENPEESWRVVHEVLGRVLELPPDDRTALLATAQGWFDHGGSAERAGEALYCHPNTVRYRLRRLQELTGRTLTEPWAVAELAAALQSYTLWRTRLDRPAPR